MAESKSYVRRLKTIDPVPCPCGSATRIVTSHDGPRVSIHRVEISREAKKHYHDRLTEYYYVLTGTGEIELDDARYDVAPGDLICIAPGTRHVLRGSFEILNVVVPAFDSTDEHVVED